MEQKSFEERITRLEDVVRKLESGNGSLDEMISLYEEGMRLHGECVKRLDEYEGKLQKLSGTKQEG